MEASSSSTKYEFDVFLSFRGADTRKGFTGHLYDRLKLHGVRAFKDSEDLERGQDINKLLDYIKQSKIFLPIFSKRYAESRWCLKEIRKMVACRRLIIPVFFDVEPAVVSDQIGHFAPAFERYERDVDIDHKEVNNWRRALKAVGKLSGFHLKNDTDGDEAKLVLLIVKRLLSEVRKLPFPLPQHLIGVDAHVHEVKKLLSKYCRTVQFIGIHGIGGIGKTTIAKAIYNELFLEFDASSFLFNIREKFQQNRELELQRQLTCQILKSDERIYDIEHGKSIIKNGMESKRVLIILDDVDDRYQVDALAGGSDWFGHGSAIFITTRNKKVLKQCSLSEGQIYKVNGLNYDQSCDLLRFHAFKGRKPENGCRQQLDAFVKGKTSSWIPLALEVIGSTLFVSEVQDWKHVLKDLQNNPDLRIQQQLRISYDGLKEERQKQIFLDISCFFIGKDREKATHMWKACDWCPERVIPDLRSRSLIDIDQHGEFSMHDLIRDMGREIVRQEAPENDDFWKRSRLWRSQDIFNLLRREEPNEDVNKIMLPKDRNDFEDSRRSSLQNRVAGQRSNPERCFSAQCIELMRSLRILHLDGLCFEGNFQHFPKDLRWLVLENCVFTSPPNDFDIEKVVVLDLSGCSRNMAECLTNNSSMGKRLIQRWSSFFFSPLYHVPSFANQKVLSNLKFLSLAWTEISSTPDFTNVRCLEQLILSDCTKLTTVHESIGVLKSLLSLDLGGCEILRKIPDSICELSSLKSFDLQRCVKVSSLPGRLWNMTSLEKLYLDMTSIEILPDSIGSLTSLQVLSLKKCKLKTLPASLRNLLCLQHLIVQHTSVKGSLNSIDYREESVEVRASSHELLAVLPNLLCRRIYALSFTDYRTKELPYSVKHMTNLSSLYLRCMMLRQLPAYIGSLRRIKELRLDCMGLQRLPNSLGGLKELVTFEIVCASLEFLPDSLGELESLEVLIIECWQLTYLPGSIGHLENLRTLLLSCHYLTHFPFSICFLGRLQSFLLRDCRNLNELSVASTRQQNRLSWGQLSVASTRQQNRLSWGQLSVASTRQQNRLSWGPSLLQLCPSLLCLEASYCTQLRKVYISDFQSLLHLDLRGSVLLEHIDGLENISNKLLSLVLPPTCALSDKFNERSFQRTAFPRLLMFAVSNGTTDTPRNPFFPRDFYLHYVREFEVPTPPKARILWVRRGHLPFFLPNVPHTNRRLSRAQFTFKELPSPVRISVVADDRFPAFETTRQLIGGSLNLCSNDEIILRLRDIASPKIIVTADMSKLYALSASFEWETKRIDDVDY